MNEYQTQTVKEIQILEVLEYIDYGNAKEYSVKLSGAINNCHEFTDNDCIQINKNYIILDEFYSHIELKKLLGTRLTEEIEKKISKLNE